MKTALLSNGFQEHKDPFFVTEKEKNCHIIWRVLILTCFFEELFCHGLVAGDLAGLDSHRDHAGRLGGVDTLMDIPELELGNYDLQLQGEPKT